MIGQSEKGKIRRLRRQIERFCFERSLGRKGEVEINKRLQSVLLNSRLDVRYKNIPRPAFVGDTFRPEFYLRHAKRPLCAVECKLLNKKSAKGRYKEGLSQALLYSHIYKAVILVFYDFTRDGKYCQAFHGRSRDLAKQLAMKLRKTHNIYIIAIKPQ